MKIPEVIRFEAQRTAGSLNKVLAIVAEAGLVIEGLQNLGRKQDWTTWELTLEFDDKADLHLFELIDALPTARMLGWSDRVFKRHEGGKIETISKIDIHSLEMLRDVYTPGVARVCLAIQEKPELATKYTNIAKSVAIVTNGTAILGLGDIGPVAGMPVMEGKAALFHNFGGLSGIPILVDSHDPDTIIETVARIAPTFGAIQLEDIAAPECFYIEKELQERLNIPVLHDDQHGTAVVVLSALLTATKMLGMNLKDAVVGQIGLGAAGTGIANLLGKYGVRHLLGMDLREDAMQRFQAMDGQSVEMAEVMERANIVIATSGVKGLIRPEQVREGQIIFALTNPEPEIESAVALAHGARFAADGRSINNVLAFPGLFRGVLEAGADSFSDEMLIAAAEKLSSLTAEGALIPDVLDKSVHLAVAKAVSDTQG